MPASVFEVGKAGANPVQQAKAGIGDATLDEFIEPAFADCAMLSKLAIATDGGSVCLQLLAELFDVGGHDSLGARWKDVHTLSIVSGRKTVKLDSPPDKMH